MFPKQRWPFLAIGPFVVTFSPPVEIDSFRAIGISQLARRLRLEGRSIIHMEFGQPSAGAPAAAIAAAHRMLDADDEGYWESPKLCERIARYYREHDQVDIAPEQIILTCGASPALVLALTTAFAPGDRVMTARPGYVAYRNSLRALHMTPVEVDCGPEDRFQMTTRHVAGAASSLDGLIIASPANPTGTIIAPAEMAAIADACRDKGVRVVSDEIYHRLSYVDQPHSILRHAPDALVINSFSKYYGMPGWRLGWLVCPPDLLSAARARIGNLFLTPPSLSQHAALAAFDCDVELDARVKTYRENRATLIAALRSIGMADFAPPDGAFYIYTSVAHLTDDSEAFCRQLLLETGVATAPGVDFDPIRGREFIRFSFALTSDLVREACDRLVPWFQQRKM
jgi:aspartate/methionine/tyrosine aminotransferase